MSVKFLLPTVLVLTALSLEPAHGQDLPNLPGPSALTGPEVGAPAPAGEEAPSISAGQPEGFGTPPAASAQPEAIPSPPSQVDSPWTNSNPAAAGTTQASGAPLAGPAALPRPSDWILSPRPTSCYCPIGGNGPIQLELYLRNGISLPFGNSLVARDLRPDWVIQGGVRSLFFQPDMWSAWVVDLGLMNGANATHNPTSFPGSVLVPTTNSAARVHFGQNGLPGLTIDTINRTWVNIGVGKMWYINNPANAPGQRWRWGIDGGGRYGTENVEFHQINHHSNVIESAYTALYTDLEVPCGCCTFVTGLRAEYAYTWGHLLHQFNGDIQDINLLWNVGVRY